MSRAESGSAYTQPKLDALIVPGKDIGVRNNPEQIRRKQNRITELGLVGSALSLETGLNVIAAGKLFRQSVAGKIIFTTGHTAGSDIRSEAQAMKDLLKEVYPDVPDNAIILEEKSKDTSGNAEEVNKIIQLLLHKSKRVGIVDVGFHLKNALTLFRRYGVEIADQDSFASEEIVADERAYPNSFPDNYNNTPIVKKERQKELIRSILLNTIDRKGKLLRQVARLTRK